MCRFRVRLRFFFWRHREMGEWHHLAACEVFGGKLRALQQSAGPNDESRAMEDRAACVGNTLPPQDCAELGVKTWCLEWRFEGIELETTESPRLAVLGDYPSVTENPEVAASEVDRPSGLSEITWYPAGHAPPDLRVCPLQLIGKPGKVRMVHDWSNPSDGPSGALSNPGVGRGPWGDGRSPLPAPSWCVRGRLGPTKLFSPLVGAPVSAYASCIGAVWSVPVLSLLDWAHAKGGTIGASRRRPGYDGSFDSP